MSKKPSTAKPPQNSGGWVGDTANLIYLLRHPLDATLFGLGTVVWWLFSKFWLLWFALGFSLWAGVQIGKGPAPGLLVFGVLFFAWLHWRRRGPKPTPDGWWSHGNLSAALVAAGALKMEAADDKGQPGKLPTLSYQGKVVHGDYGTTVVVGLPQAQGFEDVNPRKLAQTLRVPKVRLSVWHEHDDPEHVVRIHVATPPKDRGSPPVAAMEQTDWRAPLELGHDARGKVVTFDTRRHSLFAGKTRMGKTSTGRTVLSHWFLDPTTRVMLVDGKGSTDDYGACIPLCDTFISGADDETVARDTIAMLERVLQIVKERNRAGGYHPGLLVVLEEIQDVRDECSPDQLVQLDKLTGRIIRKGGAANVWLKILTQRPSAKDMPTGVRSQTGQVLALPMRQDDFRIALGDTPTVPVPKEPGVAVWTQGGGEHQLVYLYYLTDADWRSVCKRAAILRSQAATPEPVEPTRPMLTVVPSPELTVEPVADVLAEVMSLLRDHKDGQMSATELYGNLSSGARERVGTAQKLGLTLGRHRTHVRKGKAGDDRVWRLAAPADQSARV